MDAIKRTLLFLLCGTIIGLALVNFLPGGESGRDNPEVLVVGVGDDISGRLLEQVLERYYADGHQGLSSTARDTMPEGTTAEESGMDSYLFVDCCSNTGMWALVNQDIDIGFYCAHVSVTLVNRLEGFSIYGPVVMNGEVLGYWEKPEDMHRLGVPAKREHLKELALEQYPWVEEVKEVDAKSIAISFADRELDGAVLDISRAFHLPDYQYTRVTDQDYVSFCLVVRDEIVDTPQFQTFIQYYNKTVEELNSPKKRQELYGMDGQFWDMAPLKFLYLQEPDAVG